MKQLNNILKSKLSQVNASPLDEKQNRAVESAVVECIGVAIDRYRENQNKALKLESLRLFPALLGGQFKMYLRKRSFIKAKQIAQNRANIENRPVYVIRKTDIAYSVQSSKDVRDLKKAGIYVKKVNSILMHETADFTAYPTRKS